MKKETLKKLYKGYVAISTLYTGYVFITKSRGTSKEDDRHLIGKAIDRIAGYDIDCDDIIMIDDTELHVSYNPYMHLLTNRLGSVALVIDGTDEVYVDNQYRNMSKDTQYAILCHELGHTKNNHKASVTYVFDRIKAVLNNKVLPMELEADAYAVSIIGKKRMVNALKEIATHLHGLSRKEVLLRIKELY